MSKMNIEVMEQLLKDLAANVGYDLILAPFDTPFELASTKGLLDSKQFFWPVPASVLNDKEHERFRKLCVEADIIDTVCTTSLPWPTDEKDRVAILLIDVTHRRRGSIKFVDASAWDRLPDETDMAAISNFLIHDLFPGEDLLAFQMNEDAMDLGVDDRWDEQVRLVSSCKVSSSLSLQDYLPRPIAQLGFKYERLDEIFVITDLVGVEIVKYLDNKYFNDVLPRDFVLLDNNLLELKVPAITVSVYGNFQPQKINPDATSGMVDLNEKIVLIPKSYISNLPDLDYLVEQLCKESTLRQLPFLPYPNARLEEEHLKGVLIEIPKNK